MNSAGGLGAPAQSIPQQRIVEKLDDYMSRRDYAGAERHLLYWLGEAERGRDQRGELLVRNELIGHYRALLNGRTTPEQLMQRLNVIDRIGVTDMK